MEAGQDKKEKKEQIGKELLDLFLQELSGHLDNLENALDSGSLEDVVKTFNIIQSSAKIIRFDFISRFTRNLALSLQKIHKLSARDIEVVKRVVNLLRKLEHCSSENLPGKAEEIEQKARELEKFFTQMTGLEIVEMKEPDLKSEGKICDPSLVDLFCVEAESQASILNQGLLVLESQNATGETYHNLMRAAHSLKGAAKVVGLDLLVELAHAMEDCFVFLEKEPSLLSPELMDALFQSVDYYSSLIHQPKNLIASRYCQAASRRFKI